MTRRKLSREFKIKAVRLVTDRGVAVARATRDCVTVLLAPGAAANGDAQAVP